MNDYGVYIPGAATPDERTTAALARAAELSLADARLLLTSPLPKRVRAEATSSDAAARVRLLREGGLDAFVVKADALKRTRPLRATSFRKDPIAFDPGAVALEPRLIVQGLIRSSRQVDRTMIIDDPYGPPRIERIRGEKSSEAARFIHLYGESHAQVVEIRPAAFNFRALGQDFGPTLAANVARFIALFPRARVDDTLLRCPPLEDVDTDGQFARGSNEEAALRTSTLIALDLLRS